MDDLPLALESYEQTQKASLQEYLYNKYSKLIIELVNDAVKSGIYQTSIDVSKINPKAIILRIDDALKEKGYTTAGYDKRMNAYFPVSAEHDILRIQWNRPVGFEYMLDGKKYLAAEGGVDYIEKDFWRKT